MFADRKASFKTPSASSNTRLSQEQRRQRALEEQKRRRAQKVDAARQLDAFANLTLADSEDEENDDDGSHEDAAHHDNPGMQGVAQFASQIPHDMPVPQDSNHEHVKVPGTQVHATLSKKRHKKRKKQKRNQWADKIMYAELLEMKDTDSLDIHDSDGLPTDLETGWVAVAPVPMGKRCLVVTHQSSGLGGVVPNTTLRSRLQGKSLIARFPSQLPPLTILDCILDHNWRDNGILHVLDVLQWKGQDVGDCETAFRFWWRDTRLGELPSSPPPSVSATVSNVKSTAGIKTNKTDLPALKPDNPRDRYQFPYPNTFLAVPYHTDTSYASLASTIIPLARRPRSISVDVPSSTGENGALANFVFSPPDMDIDIAASNTQTPLEFLPPTLRNTNFCIGSDGLLLYVAQASYESGTSPLSNWIPITGYTSSDTEETQQENNHITTTSGPLDQFERLVNMRIWRKSSHMNSHDTMMD